MSVKLTIVIDDETFARLLEYAAEDHDCDVEAFVKYVAESYMPPEEPDRDE